MPRGTKLPSFLQVSRILKNSLFIFDFVVLMLLACEPPETGGTRVGGPSGREHFEFYFFPLDSDLLMLHALRLEAPLTASGLKDFDSFTFLIMTLFSWCCMPRSSAHTFKSQGFWQCIIFFQDSVHLMLHALGLEAPLIPSGLEVFDDFTFFLLNLWSWCCIPPSPMRPLSWTTGGTGEGRRCSKLLSFLQLLRISWVWHNASESSCSPKG